MFASEPLLEGGSRTLPILIGAALALGLFLVLGWSFSRFDPGRQGHTSSQWLFPLSVINLYLQMLALRRRVEKADGGRTALSQTADLLSVASFLILAAVYGLWVWRASAGSFPFQPFRPLAFTAVALLVIALSIRFLQLSRQRHLRGVSF